MTINRNSILDKIRALLSKTVDNGCTEAEALAALDKARAMMDAYEVTEDDLQLTKEEKAVLHRVAAGGRDQHGVNGFLAMAIAEFCDCKAWKGADGIVFCGLPSDADFAGWLLNTLGGFVRAELANHLIGCMVPKGARRRVINGFVLGCTSRIGERLRGLCRQSAAAATGNGRALVLVKSAAVEIAMKEAGIRLGRARSSRRSVDGGSYSAGRSAGDRASFGRPVSGSSGALRIG